MQALRTRVRTVALVWLLCQAATLAAFVPDNCCVAHAGERAAKEKQEACHETEPAEPEPGDACPMHHSKSDKCCVMTSACDGAGQQLTTLFAYMATPERPVTTGALLAGTSLVLPPAPPSIHRPSRPDAPPPKA